MLYFRIHADEILFDTEIECYMQFKGMDESGYACVFYALLGDYNVVLHMLPNTMIDYYIEGRFQEVPGVSQELREVAS